MGVRHFIRLATTRTSQKPDPHVSHARWNATTTHQTFSRTTRIAETIDADAAAAWRLLTTAATYPEWNSTVVSLDGEISPGSKIRLVSTLDPSRTFTLKIKEFTPSARLAWGDALGTRVYSLTETNDGQTRFETVERIGGPVFPLFANKIPRSRPASPSSPLTGNPQPSGSTDRGGRGGGPLPRASV